MSGVLRIFAPMMIEMFCRYNVELDPTIRRQVENLLSTERIIANEDFDEEAARERILKELGQSINKFEYGEFVFNLKDVVGFNRIDKDHTAVRFFNNAICVFKLPYEDFKNVYQVETGTIIKSINDDDE